LVFEHLILDTGYSMLAVTEFPILRKLFCFIEYPASRIEYLPFWTLEPLNLRTLNS